MAISTITVAGGDLRQCFAAEYLAGLGLEVTCFHTPDFPYRSDIQRKDVLDSALEHADCILFPTPLSKDGQHLADKSACPDVVLLEEFFGAMHTGQQLIGSNIPEQFTPKLEEKHIAFHSLSELPSFVRENSALTAEALLSELIRRTPFALQEAFVLLLGYGNCGKAIGKLLLPLCREVYVLEQDPEKQSLLTVRGFIPVSQASLFELLPHCSILINTIPKQVLTEDHIRLLPDNCHLFDIASAPFGFPMDVTAEFSLPYYRLPGLPGIFSPQTAGYAIGRAIERMIEHDL